MSRVNQIIRPLKTLDGGKKVTIVLHDGRKIPAITSLVYVDDSAGVIAYDADTRKAIDRTRIKGWIL